MYVRGRVRVPPPVLAVFHVLEFRRVLYNIYLYRLIFSLIYVIIRNTLVTLYIDLSLINKI